MIAVSYELYTRQSCHELYLRQLCHVSYTAGPRELDRCAMWVIHTYDSHAMRYL